MATRKNENIVLMSIIPRFADAIIAGIKKIEYRKIKMLRQIQHVIIYSSSPISRIVGSAEIDEVVSDSPNVMWEKYGKDGFISEREFREYFLGKKIAYGYKIKNAYKFKYPLKIVEVSGRIKPPQSFRYISEKTFNKILYMGSRFKTDERMKYAKMMAQRG